MKILWIGAGVVSVVALWSVAIVSLTSSSNTSQATTALTPATTQQSTQDPSEEQVTPGGATDPSTPETPEDVPGPMVPVYGKITTKQKLAFLTIDDGVTKNQDLIPALVNNHLTPTIFLNSVYVKQNPAYFKKLITQTGAVVGDHTVDHPNMRGKSYAFQKQEICQDADDLQKLLGVRPTIFRPPYGNYDTFTRKAAAACGMSWLVTWREVLDKGKMAFQLGTAMNAGDIVLMHFKPTSVADVTEFVNQTKRAGLTPARLSDYLPQP
jgi:peptidoglycan/xylan/chitin deacetylase (PgdA/CDA1 family)